MEFDVRVVYYYYDFCVQNNCMQKIIFRPREASKIMIESLDSRPKLKSEKLRNWVEHRDLGKRDSGT